METQPNFEDLIPVELNLLVQNRKCKLSSICTPCIEIRKFIVDDNLIKLLVWSALNNVPLSFQPKFTDRLRSISSLIEKGILYREQETQELRFLK